MASSYWERVLEKRTGRRRVLAAMGATTAGAALLAACGGGDDGGGGSSQSKVVTDAVNTTSQAVRGGTWKHSETDEPRAWDPYPSGIGNTAPGLIFSRLVKTVPGVLEPTKGEIGPELAESWEYSADHLTLTFKLRGNAKWDQRAPTNSRIVDAQDVVYSWERFLKVGALRANYANSVNPQAAITTVSAPDNRTVVMKLAQPDAGLLTLIGSSSTRVLHILPRETEQIDVRTDPRGSGPYYLAEWRPSSDFVFAKNPNYWDQNVGLVDRIERPIVTDYSTGLAQFRAGRIYNYEVSPEDILPTKQDVPDLLMYQDDVVPPHAKTFYGWQDGPKSPFRDERIRQAFSMSWDRELWIDTFYNVTKFKDAGLPVETRWSTAIVGSAENWWLNPQDSKFGENARYYKHDLAEAKKLVAAAGGANGVAADAHYILTNQYGRDFQKQIEVLMAMGAEAGIKLTTVPSDYNVDWDPKYRAAKPPGNFDGVAWINMTLSEEPGAWLFSVFNSKGALFKGFDPNGQSNFNGDPVMEDLTVKLKSEFDTQKRWALAHDLQKLEAKKQYMTPFPGGASGYLLAWPALQNFRVYRGIQQLPELYYWIDSKKKPLAS